MSLKATVELCVMKMKNDTKIEEELTCRGTSQISIQALESLKFFLL